MTRWSHIFLNAALLLAPLLFGMTEPWSSAIISFLLFLSLILYLRGTGKASYAPVYPPGTIPLFLILLYMLLQLIPLPPTWLRLLAPATWEKYSITIYLLDPDAWMPISLAPGLTILAILNFTACIATYLLTVQHCLEWKRRDVTVRAIAYFAFIYAVISILNYLAPNGKVLWFLRTWPVNGGWFGTYVNKNHYSGLMEMALPLLLAFFLTRRPATIHITLKEKIIAFFSMNQGPAFMMAGLYVITVAASIFICRSRTGMAVTIFSLIFFGILTKSHGGHKPYQGVLLAVIAILFLSMVTVTGWQPILDRFDAKTVEGELREGRPVTWLNSARIAGDFIATGTGFGTFISIYPSYQTNFKNKIFDHAHNDYLEFAIEGGAVSLTLMAIFLARLMITTWQFWKKRVNRCSVHIWAGSLTGIAAILMHSITDFNMHIGANRLWFFFLCGMAVAAAMGNSRYSKRIYLDSKGMTSAVTMAAITSLMAVCLVIYICLLTASFRTALCKVPANLKASTPERLEQCIRCMERSSITAPWNPDYHYIMGNMLLALRNGPQAIKEYINAIKLDPLKGIYLQQAGLTLDYYREPDKAEALLKAGIATNISKKGMYRNYAGWLFAKGRVTEGLRQVKQFLDIAPEQTEEMLTFMTLYGVNDMDMEHALPEKAAAYICYGNFLEKSGKKETALSIYKHAVTLAGQKQQPADARAFLTLARWYEKNRQYEDALDTLRHGVDLFPDNPYLKINMARLYEKIGVNYRAVEEYRRVLAIRPAMKWVRKRLQKLEQASEKHSIPGRKKQP
jgi:tetratricopeptide (TPR) repeat protein